MTKKSVVAAWFVMSVLAGCQDKGGSPSEASKGDPHPKPGAVRETPKGNPNGEPATKPMEATNEFSNRKPDFQLTSEALSTEIQEDFQGSFDKYDGKVLEITGQVVGLGETVNANPSGSFLELRGTGEHNELSAYTKENAPWEKVLPGQTVRLRTVVTFPGSTFADCEVIAVSGDQPLTIEASQLSKAYKEDKKGFLENYAGRFAVVTGEIVMVKRSGLKDVGLDLKPGTEGAPPVSAIVPQGFGAKPVEATPGQKVRVVGRIATTPTPLKIPLVDAFVLGVMD